MACEARPDKQFRVWIEGLRTATSTFTLMQSALRRDAGGRGRGLMADL